jgi:predicted Rossmann-fold nucleotide-binding protein
MPRSLAAALQDHSIGDALEELTRSELCRGRPMVGVMGGHTARRGTGAFEEAAVAGRLLARSGRVVATGGGPGAMEAANMGAYLSELPDSDFHAALAQPSLGVPTWFYGHEPPNYFATHIAKYFANAIREAILLELCDGGVIFLPGSAGTLQEIFQDACENYYGASETIRPMVLVGREHWQRRYPAWPLLRSLAAGNAMEDRIFLVETVEDALDVVAG